MTHCFICCQPTTTATEIAPCVLCVKTAKLGDLVEITVGFQIQAKVIDARLTALKELMKARMEANQTERFPRWKVARRCYQGSALDQAGLKKAHPDLVASFMRSYPIDAIYIDPILGVPD